MPYREASPLPPDPYLAAWERLRRTRRRAFVSAPIVFPFGVTAASVLLADVLPPGIVDMGGASVVCMALFLGSGVIALVLYARLAMFRCPRCGALLFLRRNLRNGCSSCGILFGSPMSRADAREEGG